LRSGNFGHTESEVAIHHDDITTGYDLISDHEIDRL
jgi:hypothetical protein